MKTREILKRTGVKRSAHYSYRNKHISYWVLTEMLMSGFLTAEERENILYLLETIAVTTKPVLSGLDLLITDDLYFLNHLAYFRKLIKKILQRAPLHHLGDREC